MRDFEARAEKKCHLAGPAFLCLRVSAQDGIDSRLISLAMLAKEREHVRIDPQGNLFLRPGQSIARAKKSAPCLGMSEKSISSSRIASIRFQSVLDRLFVLFPFFMMRSPLRLSTVTPNVATRKGLQSGGFGINDANYFAVDRNASPGPGSN